MVGQNKVGVDRFFIVLYRDNGMACPVLVTNKHVIDGAIQGGFWVTLGDGNGNPIYGEKRFMNFADFEKLWIKHPEHDVDLCILPIAPIHDEAEKRGDHLFYVPLEIDSIPKEEFVNSLSAIEDIVMIGYPNGIWDKVNNLPVFRKGITATHPKMNYNGKAEFMIDAACFPGSSGSPVFMFRSGLFADGQGQIYEGTRGAFLGVLYAGPQHIANGNVAIPNNLGYVIKSHKILDFVDIIKREIKRTENK